MKDLFEVEKENLQDWLINQMIDDDELNEVTYLTDICFYLEKMSYNKAPNTIKRYIQSKDKKQFLIHFLPKYVYGKVYGYVRSFAKTCYWELIKFREN